MFCLSAKEHIKIQMMHQTGHFGYYKDPVNKFAALELPYKVRTRLTNCISRCILLIAHFVPAAAKRFRHVGRVARKNGRAQRSGESLPERL